MCIMRLIGEILVGGSKDDIQEALYGLHELGGGKREELFPKILEKPSLTEKVSGEIATHGPQSGLRTMHGSPMGTN